ncbi:MAG: YqiA/YcfP family alpha/beta fold hydrolase [Marinifilaceae bacterium]|jgi:predicted esterase YcpF (UPF0227 family)
MKAIRILFLHGLESEGLKPEKRKALLDRLKKESNVAAEIMAEIYDYRDPKYSFEYFKEKVKQYEPDLLMGSSFGGRIAFHLSNLFGIPSVLFNPAINSSLCCEILTIEKEWERIFSQQYYIMGTNDETVPPVETLTYLIANGMKGELSRINLVLGMEHRVSVQNFAEYSCIGIRKMLGV